MNPSSDLCNRADFGKKCYFNANTLIDFNAQELALDSY
jgi:hypothetical protein